MKKLVSFVSAFIIGFNLVYPFIYAQELDNNIIEDETEDIIEDKTEDIIEDGNPVINDEIIENISDNSEDSKELDDIIDDDNNNELSVNNVDEINENSVEDSDFTFNELVECDEKVEGEKDTIQTYSIDEGKNNIETFGEGDEPEVFTVSFDTDGGTSKDSITVTSGEILIKDVTKYSHTSNISDDGSRNGNYSPNLSYPDFVTISGAKILNVYLTYSIENYDRVYVFAGKYLGDITSSLDEGWIYKLYGYGNLNFSLTEDTMTFGIYSDYDGQDYGYYAVITGTQNLVGGNPTKEGQIFVGWYKQNGEEWNLSGDIINNDTTLYAKWRDSEATLLEGENFNTSIKSLVHDSVTLDTYDDIIRGFIKSEAAPTEGIETVVISTNDSETPIIARYGDDNNIYYYSNAGKIYLNSDSSSMFKNLTALEIIDLNKFDTSKLTNISSMFSNCRSITGLELINFYTNEVTNIQEMFQNADRLKTIYVMPESFNIDNVSDSYNMFSGAVSIVGGNGTTYNELFLDKEYARIDTTESSGYFTHILDKPYSIEYNLDDGILTGAKTSYTARETFNIDTPIKSGFVFIGWTGSNGLDLEINVSIPVGTTGDLAYYANWKVDSNNNGIADDEEYYTITWVDGNNDILKTDILLLGSIPTYTGQLPTKSDTSDYKYNFNGNRYPEISTVTGDIQYTALFDEEVIQKSGGNSSGGGGRKATDNHGSPDSLIQSGVKGNEKINTGKIYNNTTGISDIFNPSVTTGQLPKERNTFQRDIYEKHENFPEEFIKAYNFAKKYGITSASSIEDAKMYSPITRIQMAKILSYFAINVLGKEPDISKGMIKFSDVSNRLNSEYDNAVTLAYQLGIMGQNVKNNKFRPNDVVTRAEFVTALSRMLYGIEDGIGKAKYYEPHMAKLYNEGIINKSNPNIIEKRGYVMLMLMRFFK